MPSFREDTQKSTFLLVVEPLRSGHPPPTPLVVHICFVFHSLVEQWYRGLTPPPHSKWFDHKKTYCFVCLPLL